MIVHLDADAFFASVEQASDPKLRGRPIAVGGEKRGIIAAASYEARQLGIYTPMPTARARKLCPSLIILPGDFEKYERFSRFMFSYAYDITPDVEAASIDEGYIDLLPYLRRHSTHPRDVAANLRRAIDGSLKISVSFGLGSNKLISQIASKLRKPHCFLEVRPGTERSFLNPLANRWLPQVGPRLAKELDTAGLRRIEQIAATPPDMLALFAGNYAPRLHQFAQGIDQRPVIPERPEAKSYSHQETFEQDITDPTRILATLRTAVDRLTSKIREEGKTIRTVTLKLRTNDFIDTTRSASLDEPTDLETEIYPLLPRLMKKAWERRVSLRLVSLKFSNVYSSIFRSELPIALPDANNTPRATYQENKQLAEAVDNLRARYGKSAVMRGHDFWLRQGSGRHSQSKDSKQRSPTPSQRIRQEPPTPRKQQSHQNKPTTPPRLTSTPSSKPLEKVAAEFKQKPTIPGGNNTATDRNIYQIREDRFAPFARLTPRNGNKQQSSHAQRPLSRPSPPQASTHDLVTTLPLLNIKSTYSFLDSLLPPQRAIELAAQRGARAAALTDPNLHGAVEFYQAAQAAGIKPIVAAQIPLRERLSPEARTNLQPGAPTHRDRPLLAYVQDLLGYTNLCQLLSLERPVTRSELSQHQAGLIFMPADASMVALPEIRYASTNDKRHYNIVQSIHTLTLVDHAHPDKRTGSFHLPSTDELTKRYPPQALEAAHDLADRCTFEFDFNTLRVPGYTPQKSKTPHDMLRRLAFKGLERRYPSREKLPLQKGVRLTLDELHNQLNEELEIIADVGYEEYFLNVWHILKLCRKRGITWITRGSAADSLVCYCLGISGVCPIRFELYFRRFLNRDRMALNKLPDIDIDFPYDRKDEVIDLILDEYGTEHAAVVGGFNTYRARSALADIAKTLGVSDQQARHLTEHLPYARPSELKNALHFAHSSESLMEEEPHRTAIQLAGLLDGFPRHRKMHPCGIVLSQHPISLLTPTFTSSKKYRTTHFDMDAVEAVGLVKLDILAQGGLAVMRDAAASIQRNHHRTVDLEVLEPWDDSKVWEMIASGQARGVHHIESPAMTNLAKMCAVRDIDVLIAIVSVVRPGAANNLKRVTFSRRAQGLEPINYPHPSLASCLKSTFGVVAYEEHILQICEDFCAMPPGRADILRRALVKLKLEQVAEMEKEFRDYACRAGRTQEETDAVWELVNNFQGYAFCRAHSTAYGVEAYQAAWLKRYYPAEFLAAVLTHGKGFYSRLFYTLECRRLGITFRSPDVNGPGTDFTAIMADAPAQPPTPRLKSGTATPAQLDRKKWWGGKPTVPSQWLQESKPTTFRDQRNTTQIQVPLSQIKEVSDDLLQRIKFEKKARSFDSLHDFHQRVHPTLEQAQNLIRAGAFDSFGKQRTEQFWELRQIAQWPRNDSQGTLFSETEKAGKLRLPDIPLTEPDRLDRLRAEQELLGFTVSGHPLELHPNIAWESYCPLADLKDHFGERVTVCGMVLATRDHHQLDGRPMKFLTLCDYSGMAETELFADAFAKWGVNTIRYPVLQIEATVEPFDNRKGFTLRVHRATKPRERSLASAA